VLIDGGGSNNPDKSSSVGELVVVPFLMDKGVSSLDAVVATHGHSDHIEGLAAVLEKMKVETLILPETDGLEEFAALTNIALRKSVEVVLCSEGDYIKLDKESGILVLNPEKTEEGERVEIVSKTVTNAESGTGTEAGSEIGSKARSETGSETALNNKSLVLKLTYKDFNVLFTGDSEAEVERRLLESGADCQLTY
jgi:competence protein ComEC